MIILKRETMKQKDKKDQIFPCKKKRHCLFWNKIMYLSSAHSLGILMLQPRLATWVSPADLESWQKYFFFICNFAEAKEKLMHSFTCAVTWMFNFLSLIFLWPLQTTSQMQIKRKSVVDIWWGISICYFPAFFATIQKNHQLIRIFFSIINHKISIL